MDRRSYLGALAAAGVVGAAGCLETISGSADEPEDDTDTVLGPPEEERGDPIHPTHGEEFPDFSVPDPLAGEEVSLDDFTGERGFLITFIFTSCPDVCGEMVRTLQLAQEDAAEEGYSNDIAFLAVTFDPETDDADTLREYGEQYDVDLDAGNWHFLRPETQDEAIMLVNETFGAPIDVEAATSQEHDHDDHDHDDENDDHDHDDHDHDDDENGSETGNESSIHYPLILLVNDHGIVERSYPPPVGAKPVDIIDDTRTVVE